MTAPISIKSFLTQATAMIAFGMLMMATMTAPSNAETIYFTANVNIERAEEAIKQHDLGRAEKYLVRAIRSNLSEEQKSHVLSSLCGVRLEQGLFDQALTDCEAALRLDRKNWVALNNQASIKLQQDDVDGALKDLVAATKVKPASKAVAHNLAIAKARKATMLASN